MKQSCCCGGGGGSGCMGFEYSNLFISKRTLCRLTNTEILQSDRGPALEGSNWSLSGLRIFTNSWDQLSHREMNIKRYQRGPGSNYQKVAFQTTTELKATRSSRSAEQTQNVGIRSLGSKWLILVQNILLLHSGSHVSWIQTVEGAAATKESAQSPHRE